MTSTALIFMLWLNHSRKRWIKIRFLSAPRTSFWQSSLQCTRISSINNLTDFFRSLSVKWKLVAGFLLIITINAATGIYGYKVINDLGDLVKRTYDNALMSGTFAQSAKFSLSQFDMEVQSALLSMDKDEFERHSKMARRSFKTLKEDLEVFRERSLETVDTDDVLKNLTEVENKSNELLST